MRKLAAFVAKLQINLSFTHLHNLCNTRTRQASQRCSNVQVVLFLYTPMVTTIPFNKGYSAPHDIVSLLQSRGLYILDTNKAQQSWAIAVDIAGALSK